MIIKRKESVSIWKITIEGKHGIETHLLKTSPIVLGSSPQCDIVIKDKYIADFHIQFVLINNGKSIEIYNLANADDTGYQTFIDGTDAPKKIIKAQHNKEIEIRTGTVSIILKYAIVKEDKTQQKSSIKKHQSIEWFYLHDGKENGPVEMASLLKAAQEGLLLPTDDVWHTGIDYRIKAFEVPDLFSGERSSLINFKRLEDFGPNVCPYCWHRFQFEDVLFIARHPELLGDPVLGEEEQQRFLPRHFKAIRKATDAKGEVCPDMACPRCHLRVPIPFLDSLPMFFSIIGTPGCGKSYYLASSTWRLRKILPQYFGLNFEDVDNVTNHWLNDYEEKLFFPVNGIDYQSIEKTQIEASNISRQVKINEINMFLSLPCIFTLISNDNHNSAYQINRTLSFYDNAGEHFQTGQDVIQKPGTLHMLRAQGFLFMFDPTSDPRFDSVINESVKDQIPKTAYHQQKILIETIDRIRKYIGLNVTDRFEKPVVIGLSKADLLTDYFRRNNIKFKTSPFIWLKKQKLAALNLSHINKVSHHIRMLFYELVPEFVNTIESFAKNVAYLPISAIGHQPDTKGVNSKNINPLWIEIPFLFILSKLGIIPSLTTKSSEGLSQKEIQIKDHSIIFKSPGQSTFLEMPLRYCGQSFTCPESQKQFRVPNIESDKHKDRKAEI